MNRGFLPLIYLRSWGGRNGETASGWGFYGGIELHNNINYCLGSTNESAILVLLCNHLKSSKSDPLSAAQSGNPPVSGSASRKFAAPAPRENRSGPASAGRRPRWPIRRWPVSRNGITWGGIQIRAFLPHPRQSTLESLGPGYPAQ